MLNFLEKIFLVIGAIILAIGSALVSGMIFGTLLFLFWPVVVSNIFPGLVESGIIAGNAPWWPCVCFMFLVWLLKSNFSSKSNKD